MNKNQKHQNKLIDKFSKNIKDRDQGLLFEHEKNNIYSDLIIIFSNGFKIYMDEENNFISQRKNLKHVSKNIKRLIDITIESIEILNNK